MRKSLEDLGDTSQRQIVTHFLLDSTPLPKVLSNLQSMGVIEVVIGAKITNGM